MTDFVEILDNYCSTAGIKFVYGRKASLNLLDNRTKLAENTIYLMCEPFTRTPERTTIGKVKSYLFNGSFFLVVNSNLDMPIYNEVGNDASRSKYKLNVKPLLEIHKQMVNSLGCSGIDILKFDAIDVYDIFDQNKDGILITFSVRTYEY